MPYSSVFEGKKILMTGNTGFKGSWLSTWLARLNADVTGFSIGVPTEPSLFYEAGIDKKVHQIWGDVRDVDQVRSAVERVRPDFVFHLAAQPLVRDSYLDPFRTFQTNFMGTLNLLEALRVINHSCVAVFVTSDKCYDNVEQVWGYREVDKLGGKDPYSGSKGAAELVLRSYFESFFRSSDAKVRIGIGRAGNVIGGGDWAKDRVVPDAVRAWSTRNVLKIRSPKATRPWQHVLEPLSGYLTLASFLLQQENLNGEAFNFGPPAEQNHTVGDLLDEMKTHWNGARWTSEAETSDSHEAGLLKLSCDKALSRLGWHATLNFDETVSITSEWYRTYYSASDDGDGDLWSLTQRQIENYEKNAALRGVTWAS